MEYESMAYMSRGTVMVANPIRDRIHDKSHNMTQKQADTRDTSGCLSASSITSASMGEGETGL